MSSYADLKLPDIRDLLRNRGLKVTGNKPELVARLRAHDVAVGSSPDAAEPTTESGASQLGSRKRKDGDIRRYFVVKEEVRGDAAKKAKKDDSPTLGEQVLFNKLLRDQSLAYFNPRKLEDFQHVIEMRCYDGLLSDIDLKECYFQRLHGFVEKDFVLADWKNMTLKEVKGRVIDVAFTHLRENPAARRRLNSMRSKKAIMKEYGMLAIVPWQVYRQVRLGLEVLEHLRTGFGRQLLRNTTSFAEGRSRAEVYLGYACICGLDEKVIIQLIEEFGASDLARACRFAAMSNHVEVIDFLVDRYQADVTAGCLHNAASHGFLGLIDHLVRNYGIDPAAPHYKDGGTALHYAADSGNVTAIRYLVEKHHVDPNIRDIYQETALTVARRFGYNECATLLREYMGVTEDEDEPLGFGIGMPLPDFVEDPEGGLVLQCGIM